MPFWKRGKTETAQDPICGMEVEVKKAEFKSDYVGKTYYFCAKACKDTFDKDPAKYTANTPHPTHHH